jgi:hypothetical protein
MQMSWDPFTVNVSEGRLVDGQTISGTTYSFRQSADCAVCESGGAEADRDYTLTIDGGEGIGSDGAVMAQTGALGTEPAWGPLVPVPGGETENVFRRPSDSGAAGMIFLPGFEAQGTGGSGQVPVVQYLLGARQATSAAPGEIAPGTHFRADSRTAGHGNEFLAGVTVGPQTYRSSSTDQPVAGLGEDLSGSATRIAFGGAPSPDVRDVPSNAATKYVVRRAGITGAFNSDATAAPSPTVYGYPLALRRFAFRQVSNVLDEETWIDGSIAVPAPADFNISFSSLDLACSGELGGGAVDSDDCADPSDNNGNGVADENCNERLRAWRTHFRPLSMAFVPEDETDGECDGGDRRLRVGSVIQVHALEEELGLLAIWDPNGDPRDARVSGRTVQVLDKPAAPADPSEDAVGFDYAMDEGIALREISDDQGWFEFTGSLAVPFWDALSIKARLENESVDAQDQSILVGSGFELPDESNDDAAAELKNDPNRDLSAFYTWGSTGWSVPGLPLYYARGRYPTKRPQFLGRTQESFDLWVMNAKAGVDFVDPLRTQMSFGASANFELLAQLEVDLHVDLNDPESVARVDRFLNRLGVSGSPVGTLIGEIKNKMNLMNGVVDAGLDAFLEEAVRDALPLEPFQDMADLVGQVQSFPEQAASTISSFRTEVVDPLVAPLSDTLDRKMIDVYADLPGLILAPNSNALDAVIDDLEQADDALRNMVEVIDDTEGVVEDSIQAFIALVSQTIVWVGQANSTTNAVRNAMSGAQLTDCNSTNPLWGQINEVQARVEAARNELENVQLVGFASGLAAAAGVNLGAIGSAERDIHDLAQDIFARLDSASGTIDGALGHLCAGYERILDDPNAFVTGIESAVSGVPAAMFGLDPSLVEQVGIELERVRRVAAAVQLQIQALRDVAELARAGQLLPPPFAGFTTVAQVRTELDSRMSTATAELGGIPWCNGPLDPNSRCERSFIEDLAVLASNPIDQAIQGVANDVSSGIGPLTGVFPQPSGEELRDHVVDLIMNDDTVEDVNRIFYESFSEIAEVLNVLNLRVFDQLNMVVQDLLKAVEERANELLQAATGALEGVPFMRAAEIDGYAVIAGNELERLHVGAFWTMSGDDAEEENTTRYGAALDVTSWTANGKDAGCAGGPIESGSSPLDAAISVYNAPIEIGQSEITIRELYLGITIAGGVPVNVFGGVSTEGDIDFEAFQIYDPAFHSGVGASEVYLGAKAGALFDRIQMEVAFLVGLTCNLEVLQSLDPQVAEFLEVPGGRFNGAFLRGSASFPVWDNGCFLTVGVGADAGAWLLIGPPLTVGGLLGGAAYGEALCIAALRGQITLFAQQSGNNFSFRGDGFGVGGLGFDCDPHTWTTVARSRDDDWCGTGDAQFSATYNRGFQLGPVSTSAIH